MQEKQIILSDDLILSKTISNYAVASYCVLKCIALKDVPVRCVSVQELCFYLTGKLDNSQRLLSYIKEGLEELIEKKIVTLIDCQKGHYVIDCSALWIKENKHYTTIRLSEIQKIFKVKNVMHCFLLRYFIFIISSFDWKIEVSLDSEHTKKHILGNMSVQFFVKELKISESAIISYNKILEEIKLLYVYRHNYFIADKVSDTVYRPSNIYGRYEDKEYIIKYGKSLEDVADNFCTHTSNVSVRESNKKRKLMQRYNQLCKGKDNTYSQSDILEIYYFIQEHNKKYQAIYEKNPLKTYKDKIKDISVFNKYSFIKDYAF